MTKTLIEERELTYEERAIFGTCPVCGAEQGEYCYDGPKKPEHGVHLGRIQNAPRTRKVYFE